MATPGVPPLDPSNLLLIVEDENSDNYGRDIPTEDLVEEKIESAFIECFRAVTTGLEDVGFSPEIVVGDLLYKVRTLCGGCSRLETQLKAVTP